MEWGVIGHERAVALLSRALTSGRLSHAYLLGGPASIGKRTLALALARAVLCISDTLASAPCGKCASCTRIEGSSHPDLRIVELDGEHVQISRKQIGELQADASLKPLIGARKVYVLIEVERLSDVAGNQLLKLLEEPPPGVMFILTTSDAGAVLPTILSRCQVVRMQPVARAVIEAYLLTLTELAPETARSIAEIADGRIGWAIRAGSDPDLIERREIAVRDLFELIDSARLARLLKAQELAGRWSSDRTGVIDALDWWAAALRDLAVSAATTGAAGRDDRVKALSMRISPIASAAAARAAQQTARLLEQNVNPRLALDTLVLDLPSLSR